MQSFTAVAVVMQETQRENLGDKRYSEGINKKKVICVQLAPLSLIKMILQTSESFTQG